ncbi:MAG: hypothetical protein CVU77_02035 [Elusimicrobia bacterium HGW-Elusimicrobia-1]|jgi:hypothetical protein|nr:MAG: hypothetical protein CVU77_02035 [Elusimicrobia bacterium HGW-Elusimicrobia-1]
MKKNGTARLPSGNAAAVLNPPLSPFFKGGLRGNFRGNQDKSWRVAVAAKTDAARFPRTRRAAFAACFFLLAANGFSDEREPVSVSEPVFRESPVAIEQQGDVSIDEPLLRKQTFIPDSPQFRLPDIPSVYFMANPSDVRRLDFGWAAGSHNFSRAELSYIVSTGAARLELSAAAASSFGPSPDGKLSRASREIAAARSAELSPRVSLDVSAGLSEKSVRTLEKTRASFAAALGYHPADGVVVSARGSSQNIDAGLRPSAEPAIRADYRDADVEARFLPDADTAVYGGIAVYSGGLPSGGDISMPKAGLDKIFFDVATLSAEVRNESGNTRSSVTVGLRPADGFRVYVSRRDGYRIIAPDDLYPDGLFVVTPSDFRGTYPENVLVSAGARYAPRSASSAGVEFTRREITNHFYLKASSSAAALEPSFVGGAVEINDVAGSLKHRLGGFELTVGFLYNTGESVPGFPKLKSTTRVGYTVDGFSAGLTHEAASSRMFGISPEVFAADLSVVDLDAEIRFAPGLFLLASARNVFSAVNEIQPGFVSDEREFTLGIKASF